MLFMRAESQKTNSSKEIDESWKDFRFGSGQTAPLSLHLTLLNQNRHCGNYLITHQFIHSLQLFLT